MSKIEQIEDMHICFIKVLLKPGCRIQVVTPILQDNESPYKTRFAVTFSEPESKSDLYIPEVMPFFEMKGNTLQIDATKDHLCNLFEKIPYGFFISIPQCVCLTFDYATE